MTQRKAAAAPASAIPDPIFALIEEHQAAFELSDRLSHGDDDDHEWLESIDMEMRLWKRLVGTEPAWLALRHFAEYVDSYPEGGDDDADVAIATIAEALRDLAPAAVTRINPKLIELAGLKEDYLLGPDFSVADACVPPYRDEKPPGCPSHLVLNSAFDDFLPTRRAHERWLKQHSRRESAGEG